MPGMSASVSSSIFVMENPSPTFSSFTVAPVWMRFGVMPARERCTVSAIVKQPAWAAPINSSGLVADWPASNRDLNEYGPSKAPLPTLSRPLPSARLPFHSASALCVGIRPPSLCQRPTLIAGARPDRKSTRLNSSHLVISYAVFCLKKKKIQQIKQELTTLYTVSLLLTTFFFFFFF